MNDTEAPERTSDPEATRMDENTTDAPENQERSHPSPKETYDKVKEAQRKYGDKAGSKNVGQGTASKATGAGEQAAGNAAKASTAGEHAAQGTRAAKTAETTARAARVAEAASSETVVGPALIEAGVQAAEIGLAAAKDLAHADLTLKNLRKYAKDKAKWGKWIALIIFIVILIIFGLVLFFLTMSAQEEEETKNKSNTLTIVKSVDKETANVGDTLNYTMNFSSTIAVDDVTITDVIPVGTEFVSAGPIATCDNGTCNALSKSVTWSSKTNFPASSGNGTFTLSVKTLVNDMWVINKADGVATPATGSAGYVPPAPASNNCGGKYDFTSWPDKNPLGNYGDPLCNFTQPSLSALISSLDPQNLYWWYNVIVPRETGWTYSPNSWADPNFAGQCSLDCGGAWGLFQMGSSTPPGQPPPAPGKNGIYDRGDVNWQVQTANAINYNNLVLKLRNCYFWYWRSARDGDIPQPPAQPC